jgi:hypothetical protein
LVHDLQPQPKFSGIWDLPMVPMLSTFAQVHHCLFIAYLTDIFRSPIFWWTWISLKSSLWFEFVVFICFVVSASTSTSSSISDPAASKRFCTWHSKPGCIRKDIFDESKANVNLRVNTNWVTEFIWWACLAPINASVLA